MMLVVTASLGSKVKVKVHFSTDTFQRNTIKPKMTSHNQILHDSPENRAKDYSMLTQKIRTMS